MKKRLISLKGLKKIKTKLNQLRGKRKKILANLRATLGNESNTRENEEYTSMKEIKQVNDEQIEELESTIKNAEVAKEDGNNDKVGIGSKIRLKDLKEEMLMEYEIVGEKESNPLEDKISYNSPIGQALMGAKVGDKVKAKTPRGENEYEVIKIE